MKSSSSKGLKGAIAAGGGKKPSLDLDKILDSALDEFEELELQRKAANQGNDGASDAGSEALAAKERKKKEYTANMEQMSSLMFHLDDPTYGPTVSSTLMSLSGTAEGITSVNSLFTTLDKQFDGGHQPSFLPTGQPEFKGNVETGERDLVSTLQMLNQAQAGMEGVEAGRLEEVGERMMEDMIAQFEALGEKEDYNEVIDGVMRQLLSKDLMYEPSKQICDRFPEWLALHKQNLSDAEYTNYGKQYQTFQKLLAVYDSEPDNFPRLMELMFDLQSYGQPPADIIKDLAPGLKFDENGMPIMPNMGAGMMPEMGGDGLPNLTELSERMASGQCSIM